MSEGKEAEQLHIGQKLKDARVAKGMTLDDLQQETKIQKRYLIAIEDEKFDELPGDFYVRAFVKQYANTVGLDGNDLLKQYDDYLPKTKTETYTEHLDEAVETRTGQHHQNTVDRIDQLRKYLPTIIVVLIVVVVLAAIWLTAIVRNHNNSSTKIDSSSVKVSGESSHKKAKKKTKSADKIKLSQTQRTNSAVTFKSDKALKKSTKLQVSTSGNSYNVVRVDDRQRLAKTMNDGDKSTVTIAKNVHSITIRVGNARNTKIKIGNQTLDITDHNRYPQTRTVTIQFGDSDSSSSSSTSNSNNSTRTTTNTTNNDGGSTSNNTTSSNDSGSRTTTSQPATRPTTGTQNGGNNNGGSSAQGGSTGGNAAGGSNQ